MKADPDALWAAIYLNLCTSPISVRVSKAGALEDEGRADLEDSDANEEDDDDELNETKVNDAN
jgi:hypothetical protein